MPELPEVETIKRQIENYLPLNIEKVHLGKNIKSILKINGFNPKGEIISSIDRYGKYLIFNLSDDLHILSHLGMSGSWQISNKNIMKKHTHLKIKCSSRKKEIYLSYVDPRRFGQLHFANSKYIKDKISKLGIDVSTRKFTPKYIYDVCQKYGTHQIKSLLLEQKYFAGIGNYMASEICALSKIHPERIAKKITSDDAICIKKSTNNIIKKNIKSKGLSFHGGYIDATGQKGEALSNLVVFFQKNCGMCDGDVKKIKIKGRGTYYCPNCQSR